MIFNACQVQDIGEFDGKRLEHQFAVGMKLKLLDDTVLTDRKYGTAICTSIVVDVELL